MIHFVFQLVIWLFSMFVRMYVIGLSWTPFHSFHSTHIYHHSTILLVCIMHPIWRLSSVLLSLSFHVDWQVCWLFPLALLFHKWRPIHVNWNHNYKYLECLDMVWLCRMSVLCLLLNMNWYLWCPINHHNQQSSVVIQILCAKTWTNNWMLDSLPVLFAWLSHSLYCLSKCTVCLIYLQMIKMTIDAYQHLCCQTWSKSSYLNYIKLWC